MEPKPLLLEASDSLSCSGIPLKEYFNFEVVDFASPYHALLGRPCYTKFMAVLHYGCLKLKIPGPRGVIVVATSVAEAYRCEQEGTAHATTDVAAIDFARI